MIISTHPESVEDEEERKALEDEKKTLIDNSLIDDISVWDVMRVTSIAGVLSGAVAFT